MLQVLNTFHVLSRVRVLLPLQLPLEIFMESAVADAVLVVLHAQVALGGIHRKGRELQ